MRRHLVILSGGLLVACDSEPVLLVPEVAHTDPQPAQLVRLPIDAAASPAKIAEAAASATRRHIAHGSLGGDLAAPAESRRHAGRDRGNAGRKLVRSEQVLRPKGDLPEPVKVASQTSAAASLLAIQDLDEEASAREEEKTNTMEALDARSECDWNAAAVTEDRRCSEELWSVLRGTRDAAQLRCEEDAGCRGLMFYNNRGGDGRTVPRGFYQGCGGDVGTVADAAWDTIVRPAGCAVPTGEEPGEDADGEVVAEPPAAAPPSPPRPPPPPQPPPAMPEPAATQDAEPDVEDHADPSQVPPSQCLPPDAIGEEGVAAYLDCLVSNCEDSAACRLPDLQEASCGLTVTHTAGLEQFTGGQRMQKEALCPSECELCALSVSREDAVASSAGVAPDEAAKEASAEHVNTSAGAGAEPLIPLVKDRGHRLSPGAAAAIAAAAAAMAF